MQLHVYISALVCSALAWTPTPTYSSVFTERASSSAMSSSSGRRAFSHFAAGPLQLPAYAMQNALSGDVRMMSWWWRCVSGARHRRGHERGRGAGRGWSCTPTS